MPYYSAFALVMALLIVHSPLVKAGHVKTGLDVLVETNFAALAGKRVGLLTAETATTHDGRRAIDVLASAPNVHLAAIFAPEHGLSATRSGQIEDGVDEATGVPIFSLYRRERRRPTSEMLNDLDAFVYDIPNFGARFLTRMTLLGYCIEAAAEKGIPFYVLDRPNMINGADVAGPLLDEKYVSFVGYMRIPIQHGMTAGEFALMVNGEKRLDADVQVIRMEGWKRAMWYDETGLEWVNPSPNIRNLTQAILYPGSCLLESRQISVGRGTDTPFQIVGAPWLRAKEIAAYLNSRNIPGVRFMPRRFQPEASVYSGQVCEGLDILLVNREVFDPVLMGLEMLAAVIKFHPEEFQLETVMRLLGSDEAASRLKRGETGAEILQAMQGELDEFLRLRSKYLLYE
ncbi:MAG: exo-beta-N-acetylmuramidase NamZ family protein [Acidobacteriota bacterium]